VKHVTDRQVGHRHVADRQVTHRHVADRHVADRFAAWLGGELDTAAAAALETHLRDCAECRREAAAQRAAWNVLQDVAGPPPSASLWPAVRARTFGAAARGWFFGGSPALRGALAAATLAVGVLAGRLTGGLAASAPSTAEDDGTLAAVWQEEATWHDASDGGLAASWLAVAADDGIAGTAGGGGSR